MGAGLKPDGATEVTVYNRDTTSYSPVRGGAVTVYMRYIGQTASSTAIYHGCTYQGSWWSPDGQKLVLSLASAQGTQLLLDWITRSSESNLNAYLSMGVEMNELAAYGLPYGAQYPMPEVEYQFLQWGADSASMLIYYSFTDVQYSLHQGYFWYNCEDGTIKGALELHRGE